MFTAVNSIEGKRQMIALYSKMIQDIDSKKEYTPETLKRRNKLVELNRQLNNDIPLRFSEGEKVIVKLNRNIEAKILEASESDKMYLIKPIDTLYTSEQRIHESMIIKSIPT